MYVYMYIHTFIKVGCIHFKIHLLYKLNYLQFKLLKEMNRRIFTNTEQKGVYQKSRQMKHKEASMKKIEKLETKNYN